MTVRKIVISIIIFLVYCAPAFAGKIDTGFDPEHLRAINKERTSHGLDPVTMSRTLNKAMQIRAKEQVDLYGHQRPDGRDCWSVLGDVDPDFAWSPSGENCAQGYNTVASVMEGWMNSSGHRANILSPEAKRVGVATYIGDDGRIYWVQMFSRNAPDDDYYGEDDDDNHGDGGYKDTYAAAGMTNGGCDTGMILPFLILIVWQISARACQRRR